VGEQLAMLIMTGRTLVDISELRYERFKAKI
jgi:hypothetical protein